MVDVPPVPDPEPPYDVPMPPRFAQTPFAELPPGLKRRVLSGQHRASAPPVDEG